MLVLRVTYEYVMCVIDVSNVEKYLGVSQDLRFEFFS
jgi:hypothetical protein